MDYPLSTELRHAIEVLFEESSVGLGFLGRGAKFLTVDAEEETLSPKMLPELRAKRLRQKLESYIAQMAAEALELGEEELPRLRAEATATLVVLRELKTHFPEAFSADPCPVPS